jgi:hypothetical protein
MTHDAFTHIHDADPPTEWRQIPSYPGYFASRDGKIRGKRGRIMKPVSDKRFPPGWYPRLTVQTEAGEKNVCVHVLVCEAFHGARPSSNHCVAHNDGNAAIVHADNLRWATYKENSEDMVRHGHSLVGEKNPRARLTESDVREIRRIYAASKIDGRVKPGTRQELAAQFCVNLTLIKDVVAHRSWRHIHV